MEIEIDPHTIERAGERGTSLEEIEEVIRTGHPMEARAGRLCKFKVFEFSGHWRGRYYEQKRVEVVYTVEGGAIITVTVYVFYGRWRE